ncbi:hypothetical protein COW81_02435 [Candidatus Campbellbacteria bacterium CG22_combo_CG10-13_8_21_14_all_36_13]|uniref:Uncharacterized protein n=1 Tax=Candidatus Campbellbacteria bacterium CG22_combo_CG10-13_8_21_14_all_36_13 TaxID=1974529 RepID=A0A2H0DXW1_9BACT|nr:MAG: hypothetical protein COW81_02435 [Candidatus Campbellbacteria bacterium CG22_combo_CG10-13_8_21_14_all_36_13]
MKKHPFFNALFAGLYIVLIVFIISTFVDSPDQKGTILIPMTILSLLVLSVATMAFLFGYEPFRLFYDGQRKEAVQYFLRTILYFALIALSFLAILLFTPL